MKVVVLFKSVPDTAAQLRVAADGSSIETSGLDYIANPYDEYALEEAVRLREELGGEVIVISMGNDEATKCIRQALALGADSAIQVKGSGLEGLSSCGAAKVLAAVIAPLAPDLLLAGKQAVDDDAAQVPERIAEILGIAHVSAITRLQVNGQQVSVDRQLEGGYRTIETDLPALFTTEKGLNTPRYPKLPDILKAKRKEITAVDLDSVGAEAEDLVPGLVVDALVLSRQQRTARILDGEAAAQVEALIPLLRDGVFPQGG